MNEDIKNNVNKNNIFNDKKVLNISLYIFLLISIVLVTLTTTYAWFDEENETINEFNADELVSVSHEGIELTTLSITTNDLVPASIVDVESSLDNTDKCILNEETICFLYEFTVTNNGDSFKNILYKLRPIENTFTNLKFKIYNSNKTDITSSSSTIMRGNLLTRNDLTEIDLTGVSRKINKSESFTYTILFWIEKQDSDQTILDAGKKFSAELSTELFTTGYGYMDVDSPVISDVTFSEDSRSYADGKIGDFTISWNGTDIQSGIKNYVVELVDSSGNIAYTQTVDGSVNTIKDDGINGTQKLTRGVNYYARVYGIDEKNNSGEVFCSETNSEFCAKSATTSLQYLLIGKATNYATISTSVSNIYYGGSVSFNVSRSCSNGVDSSSWSIKYGNSTTSFNSGNGTGSHTVSNLTNDFTVDGSVTCSSNSSSGGSCLIEGTDVLLASGKYKKIEDINYDDLLTVIDYQNGGITYQYPAWLEKESLIDEYTKITFSDDTIIKIAKDHAFFSYDHNEFININNPEKFYVGLKVANYKDDKLGVATVKSIENVKETVKYYHVVSTRYYNIIANDLVTTDDVVFVTNLYGFNSDITWKNEQILDVYSHKELPDMPYYIYKALRMGEGKIFASAGIGLNEFSSFLLSNQLNEEIWNKPKLNENGKRQWMVTTSDDVVLDKNKSSYLMEEGDFYTLKEPKKKIVNNKKFVGWVFTGENTIHQPGEKVKVIYGMHFIAKYDDLIKANISDLK